MSIEVLQIFLTRGAVGIICDYNVEDKEKVTIFAVCFFIV